MTYSYIPYRDLSTAQLLDVHNQLALARGKPSLKAWHNSRCRLVERVAILRTHPVCLAPRSEPSPREDHVTALRAWILECLSYVSHYQDATTGMHITKRIARRLNPRSLRSVGLPYSAILKQIKHRFPHSKTSEGVLRWVAHHVRLQTPGYAQVKLPDIRPQSHWKQSGKLDGFQKPHSKPGQRRCRSSRNRKTNRHSIP